MVFLQPSPMLEITGQNIEPVSEDMKGHYEHDDDAPIPWGKALGAALIINLVTLTGIIFSLDFIASAVKNTDPVFLYASFAVGDILSCHFYIFSLSPHI